MAGCVAAAALAGLIALGMACGGEAPPMPAPTAILTATATAATPTASVVATATPVPTATATVSATPVPTPTTTATPTPTAASATLAVFSTLGSETLTDEGWHRTRRVYVIDTGTGTYWRVFDYPQERLTWVLAAKASIVVADRDSVRRFAPDGRDETVLFKGENLWDPVVSPDGLKVAFAFGDGILVFDVASGEQVLRASRDAEMAALLEDASDATFSLERWSIAGDALAITAIAGEANRIRRAGILTLDGDLRVLPRNRGDLSPDLRHAIRVHNGSYSTAYDGYGGFDVIELESGRTVWTAPVDADTFIIPSPGWALGPDRFSWFAVSRKLDGWCGYDLSLRSREAGSVTAAHDCAGPVSIARHAIASWEEGFEGESVVVGPRILDVASGAIREPAQDEWRRMRADATRLSTRGSCGRGWAACGLWYEGRPLWTGPALQAVGLIESDEPFEPRGVEVRATPRPSAPEAPPTRGEMTGPLLAWSEVGGHEAETGEDGAERFHALRRVMVHDAGAKRSWRAFDYRYPPPDYVAEISWAYADSRPDMQVQMARAGFTVWVEDGWNAGAVRFVSLDGRETTLVQHPAIRGVLLSPSGERAVVRVEADGTDGALLIFDLPSGRLNRRVDLSDLHDWFPDYWWAEGVARSSSARLEPTRWSTDETAFTVVGSHHDRVGGHRDSRAGVLSLDGAFRLLPLDVSEQALSPDFRYIVRGRDDGTAPGEHRSRWERFDIADIVDAATGRVVRSVPVGERMGRALTDYDWGWTADGRFAWAPLLSDPRRTGREPPSPPRPPGGEDEAHPVDLLDVRTGGIERLTSEEYFARYVAERSSASCPADDPVGRCTVLLDGEVVGQGQWAQVIGVVGLD